MSKTSSQKFAEKVESILPDILNNKFVSEVEDIIDIGVETYEDLLLGVVTDKDSMADPENFYDEYLDKLENFEFLNEDDSFPTLYVPNREEFNFGESLSVLQLIVEGVVGIYLELPEEDINTLLKSKDVDDKVKRRLRALVGITGSEVPLTMRFRLLHTRDSLANTVQAVLDKKLVIFPFSNSNPVDLFTPMQEYIEENIDSWIKESIDKALKLTKQRYN